MYALTSGVARGASGGTHLRAQPLGAQQHTFCSHFKRVFRQKFRPKYALKCVFFGITLSKIVSASGAPLPNPRLRLAAGVPPPDLCVVTPPYYRNFPLIIPWYNNPDRTSVVWPVTKNFQASQWQRCRMHIDWNLGDN